MKIVLEKKDFLDILLNASGNIVPRKSVIPVLTSVKLDVMKSSISITSSDNEISLIQNQKAKVEEWKENDGFLIDAGDISNLVRKLNDETLTFKFFKAYVLLVTASGEFKLPFINGKEFVKVQSIEKKDDFKINTAVFQNYINKALPFTVIDELRPAMECVHMVVKDKKVTIEAVDGVKCLRASDDTEIEKDLNISIPKKMASTYAKIFPHETTTVSINKNKISFSGDNFVLIGVLHEKKFPDISAMFNSKREFELEGERSEIQDCIERLSILHHGPAKLIKFSFGDKFQISMRDKEFGTEGKEIFLYDYEGEHMEIGLNANHLITCFKAYKGKKIKFHIQDPKTAIILSDENNAVRTLLAAMLI